VNTHSRLVHHADLAPCRNAFVDTRSPGSDAKENFTIVGDPGARRSRSSRASGRGGTHGVRRFTVLSRRMARRGVPDAMSATAIR